MMHKLIIPACQFNKQLIRHLGENQWTKRRLNHNLPQAKSPGSRYVKPVSGIRKWIVTKLMNVVEGYERVLERRFPQAFKVYQVFSVGSKEFYNQMLQYFRISQELSYGKQVRALTYQELMIYYQMPKDMMKVGPVLAIAALPFANYVIFPLAYFFPKYLLSSHFWSIQQKYNFQVTHHTRKLLAYRPVFRDLQKQLANISNDSEQRMRDQCNRIFGKLGSGTHPSVDEILGVKQVFIDKPYGLEHLHDRHMKHLCRMHGLNALPGKRPRLWNYVGFIRELDLALLRQGVNELNIDEIRKACFMRGLNPMALNREEMISWLNDWLRITQSVDGNSLSLLLHTPIFLAYNHPANWRLIH